MNMILTMADEIDGLHEILERLKRENAILRKELKDYVVNHMVEICDMSEEEAFEEADKEIAWMVEHNEGAE